MIVFHGLRVSVYSDTLFRIEYQPQARFLNLPTLMMGTRLPTEIPAQIEQKDHTLVIRTAKCQLIYEHLGDDFSQDRLEIHFVCNKQEVIWTPKSKHEVPGFPITRSLDDWPQGLPRCPQEVIVHPDGWHWIKDNAGAYWDVQQQWAKVYRQPYYENWYVFLYGDDLQTAFQDFIHLLGQPPLLPRKAFGTWISRWYSYTEDELLALLEEYKKYEVPLDILVVDADWHEDRWNGYDWRLSHFPNPQKFIDKIHQLGLSLILNDHPGYAMNDPLPEHDSHLPKLQTALREPPYKGLWACDWSRQSVVQKWAKVCLQDLLKQGADGWWIDGWTDVPFPDVDSQLWVNWQYYKATQAIKPHARVLILSRWGGLGSHRYPVQFSGDTHSNFKSITQEVEFTAYSGGVGANYWSHDIGGFHEGEINEEVYIRWFQFGALSPIFRTHSNHGTREPFRFSNQALAIYQAYMRLRYMLLPYWENLALQNHLTGFPSFAAMEFLWPRAKEAQEYHYQYCIGKSLLVAPITHAMENIQETTEKKVWLPPGKWFNVIDGIWQAGDCVVSVYAKLCQTPIFIAGGAILITALGPLSPITSGPYAHLCIHIFAGIEKNAATFYLDDGITGKSFDSIHSTQIKIGYEETAQECTICYEFAGVRDFLPQKLHLAFHPNFQVQEHIAWESSTNSELDAMPNSEKNPPWSTFANRVLPGILYHTIAKSEMQSQQSWKLRIQE